MEMSRPVVVQHHGHVTLTLDFQGQILKMLYLRNGRDDWHGTKGIWVDRMLNPHCEFELWPHSWPWPLIFKLIEWGGGGGEEKLLLSYVDAKEEFCLCHA